MTNIAELLKDAPKGTKLYSPLFGEVKLDNAGGMIYVTTKYGSSKCFTETGCYYVDNETFSTECLLFPGKGQTWSGVEIKHPYKKKFEVGDWITDGWNPPVKVSGFSLGFTYYFSEGNITSQGWNVAEDDYHLWTIADAKDGDVLALNGKPFIYSSHKYGKNYCYIDEWGQLRVNFSLVFEGNYVCPATEQERDLLFSKMREVGYEWDENKKELRKMPMFKVGDWLWHNTLGVHPILVKDYSEQKGYKVEGLGLTYYVQQGVIENEYRLWTIADAKDGDVLATNSIICIFKKLDKDGYYIISPCIYTVKGGLEVIDDENDSIGSCGFRPATKEDRELLFRKIKEAGYKWDEKKKELRKIQHYDIKNFKPFDKVLVRDRNDEPWRVAFYGYYNEEANYSHFVGTCWSKQCIPFNDDTKHLLGTTDMCPEEYINW